MTEYELVDTFYTIASLSDQLVASFITLLFAFLVASYLVRSKLDRKMTAVVVTLYSYMALRYIVIYHNVTGDIATLAEPSRGLLFRVVGNWRRNFDDAHDAVCGDVSEFLGVYILLFSHKAE